MRVLIIEDEVSLQQQLAATLTDKGFAVDVAGDGEEGLYMGREHPVDMAIIDLGLPGLSGIDVITQLREGGIHIPILILTARGRWQDKVEGLAAGADDYLVKPFHMEELLARVNALVRRAAGWAQPQLNCGPITLDTATQTVTVDGEPVSLTAFEYKVLEYLMLHAGEVISKSELTEHIYAQDFDRDSNVIEVFVGRLRRKIDPHDRYTPIETLRGRGYRLNVQHGSRS
jgi:two-component system response regulator PhoP